MLHCEDPVLSTSNDVHADVDLGAVAITPDFLVGRRIGTQHVVSNPGPGETVSVCVVEAPTLGVELDTAVQGVGQPVLKVDPRLQIANPDLDLIRSTLADGVHHERPVGAEVHHRHECSVRRVEVHRVQNDLVGAGHVRVTRSLLEGAPIDDGGLGSSRSEREVLEVTGPAR